MTFKANGKRQKMKRLPSVFSSLSSRIKIVAFAVNSRRHFSFLCDLFIIKDYTHKKKWKLEAIFEVSRLP